MAAPKGNQFASKFDTDIVNEVCELVADGLNVKAALKTNKDFPTYETWRRWKNENSEVYALYVKALQDKGESVDFMIDEVLQDLRDGLIDVASANVIIQTLKWKAAKYYPKMFGDKIDHTTNGKDLPSAQPAININYAPPIEE